MAKSIFDIEPHQVSKDLSSYSFLIYGDAKVRIYWPLFKWLKSKHWRKNGNPKLKIRESERKLICNSINTRNA